MEVAKREKLIFVYLILLLGTSDGKNNVSSLNECPTEQNKEKCCSGYRMINKTCTECIGFFGENCMNPCPSNFYGVKCDSKCNCTEGEECNPYVGCLQIRSDTGNNNTYADLDFPIRHESCTLLLKLVLILGGSQILLLVFCFTTLWLKCCRLPPQHTRTKSGNTVEYSSTTHQTEIVANDSPAGECSRNNPNMCSNLGEINANYHHYDSVRLTEEEIGKFQTNHYDRTDKNAYFTLEPML